MNQPGNVAAGSPLAVVTVKAIDAFGNSVPGVNVTMASSPASLGGTVSATTGTTTGLATFSSLSLTSAGTYTLTASSGTVTSLPSSSFTVSATTASALSFVSQPNSTTAGGNLGPVTVKLADKYGNGVSGVSIGIALTQGKLSAGSTPLITGTGGLVVFSDLVENTAGSYTLTASATNVTSMNSGTFTIGAAAATTLAFVGQVGSATVNAPLTPVTVKATDTFGNVVSGVSVAVGISPAGTLGGTTQATTIATGLAVFANLPVGSMGTYTLSASASALGLTSNPSNSFTISVSTAPVLSFTKEPATGTAGTTLPTVAVQYDSSTGSPIAGTTVSINVASGTLGGTKTATTNASGVATFSLVSTTIACLYSFIASAAGSSSATSSSFTVNPAATTKLTFLSQPIGTTVGSSFGSITVKATDTYGNAESTNINMSLVTGTLGGTTSLATSSAGLAVFTNLDATTVGTYTLKATSGTLSTSSGSFTIKAAPATTLSFISQPGSVKAGASLGLVTMKVVDAFSNGVAGVSISMTISTGTLVGTVSGTTGNTGLVVFSNLSVTKAGTYTLSAKATSAGLTALSSGFTITPATGT